MGGKGSEVMNKLLAAGLFVASIGFFTTINYVPIDILPGVLFAAGGFVLALRRDRRPVAELEPGLEPRLKQLADNLSATHADLVATQERLDRLTDERDFMRQLAQPVAPRVEMPARPVEVPPPPRASELAPPAG